MLWSFTSLELSPLLLSLRQLPCIACRPSVKAWRVQTSCVCLANFDWFWLHKTISTIGRLAFVLPQCGITTRPGQWKWKRKSHLLMWPYSTFFSIYNKMPCHATFQVTARIKTVQQKNYAMMKYTMHMARRCFDKRLFIPSTGGSLRYMECLFIFLFSSRFYSTSSWWPIPASVRKENQFHFGHSRKDILATVCEGNLRVA